MSWKFCSLVGAKKACSVEHSEWALVPKMGTENAGQRPTAPDNARIEKLIIRKNPVRTMAYKIGSTLWLRKRYEHRLFVALAKRSVRNQNLGS